MKSGVLLFYGFTPSSRARSATHLLARVLCERKRHVGILQPSGRDDTVCGANGTDRFAARYNTQMATRVALFSTAADAAAASQSVSALFSEHDRELRDLLEPLATLTAAEQEAIGSAATAEAVGRAWEANDAVLRTLLAGRLSPTMALPAPGAGAAAPPSSDQAAGESGAAGYASAAAVIAHLVRDWSDEGAFSRMRTHPPVLRALAALARSRRPTCASSRPRSNCSAAAQLRVLVPGAGAGRLAWEAAQRGYRVEARSLGWLLH